MQDNQNFKKRPDPKEVSSPEPEEHRTKDTTLVSNSKPGSEIFSMYDFGSIDERDMKLIRAVVEIIKNSKNTETDALVNEIHEAFKVEDIPMMPVTKTLWYQLTHDEPIGANIQGFRLDKDENGNKIRIPHICFSSDLDYLDVMVNNMIKKLGLKVNNDSKT